MERRFVRNDALAAFDSLDPASGDTFMNANSMIVLAQQFVHLGFEIKMLSNEFIVAKETLNRLGFKCTNDAANEIMQKCIAFPNLSLFCNLALTFPVSSAIKECPLSTMKRVKTYLRAKTADERLGLGNLN